jgi:hypothetical protein
MKDEVLKLALEALETELAVDMTNGAEVGEAAELMCEAITAIKQALAAQRQWVGLTDAELMQTMSGDWTSQFYFARAIEAKLKEKNT